MGGWLDCICIDQGSALEKGREVVNMGSYYAKSARTLIFPYGIDKVGPPLKSDGSLPVWHSRAWTVQEEALSGLLVKGNRPDSTMTGLDTKFLYAVYMADHPNADLPGLQSSIYLTARGTSSPEQFLGDFTKNKHPPADNDGKRRHLHLVKRKDLASYMMRAFQHLPPDNDVRDRAMRHRQVLTSRREWNVWSVLREMYRRGAHNSEDLVYSALSFLGVTVSPSAIQYGIGLRVIEAYNLSFDVKNDLTQESRCVQVEALEDSSGLYVGTLSQITAAEQRNVYTLFKIAPHAPILGLELIAVTQIEPPAADAKFWKMDGTSSVSTALVTFFCLVCQDAGSVKHKVGIAIVRAARFTWTIKRHTVA